MVDASIFPPLGISTSIKYLPGVVSGTFRVELVGMLPSAVVVIKTKGSPLSTLPSTLLSNQAIPAVLPAKPVPDRVMIVSTPPFIGVSVRGLRLISNRLILALPALSQLITRASISSPGETSWKVY